MNILKKVLSFSTALFGFSYGKTPISRSRSNLVKRRRIYKPFDYPGLVQVAFDHEKIHWTEEETGVRDDVHDWRTGKLTEAEIYQISEVLKVFTQQDMTVAGFYETVLLPIFINNDVQAALMSFAAREQIHIRAYSLLNDTLGIPESEYSAFIKEKELADKIDFAMRADPSTIEGMALAIVKAIINEGLSLFGSFVPLLNYQRRGLMKGMGTIVEWSIRDETIHANTMIVLFRMWVKDHPQIFTDKLKKKIYDMFREAVRLEDAFIDKIYKLGPVTGLKKEDLKAYIRFLADFRLLNMGMKANYGIKENPIEWLAWMLVGPDHSNFFEKNSTEYERKTAVGSIDFDRAIPDSFVVFGWDGCRFCDKVKEKMDVVGVNFTFENLATQEEKDEFFAQAGLDKRTAPQVYAITNGVRRHIGGADKTIEMLDSLFPSK